MIGRPNTVSKFCEATDKWFSHGGPIDVPCGSEGAYITADSHILCDRHMRDRPT